MSDARIGDRVMCERSKNIGTVVEISTNPATGAQVCVLVEMEDPTTATGNKRPRRWWNLDRVIRLTG